MLHRLKLSRRALVGSAKLGGNHHLGPISMLTQLLKILEPCFGWHRSCHALKMLYWVLQNWQMDGWALDAFLLQRVLLLVEWKDLQWMQQKWALQRGRQGVWGVRQWQHPGRLLQEHVTADCGGLP